LIYWRPIRRWFLFLVEVKFLDFWLLACLFVKVWERALPITAACNGRVVNRADYEKQTFNREKAGTEAMCSMGQKDEDSLQMGGGWGVETGKK
jgi:hypothetical protein